MRGKHSWRGAFALTAAVLAAWTGSIWLARDRDALVPAWTVRAGSEIAQVLSAHGRLFVLTQDTVNCYDPRGRLLWEVPPGVGGETAELEATAAGIAVVTLARVAAFTAAGANAWTYDVATAPAQHAGPPLPARFVLQSDRQRDGSFRICGVTADGQVAWTSTFQTLPQLACGTVDPQLGFLLRVGQATTRYDAHGRTVATEPGIHLAVDKVNRNPAGGWVLACSDYGSGGTVTDSLVGLDAAGRVLWNLDSSTFLELGAVGPDGTAIVQRFGDLVALDSRGAERWRVKGHWPVGCIAHQDGYLVPCANDPRFPPGPVRAVSAHFPQVEAAYEQLRGPDSRPQLLLDIAADGRVRQQVTLQSPDSFEVWFDAQLLEDQLICFGGRHIAAYRISDVRGS